jgi:hypothetical protein
LTWRGRPYPISRAALSISREALVLPLNCGALVFVCIRQSHTLEVKSKIMANEVYGNALGLVETRGLIGSIEAADAMVKSRTSAWWARNISAADT